MTAGSARPMNEPDEDRDREDEDGPARQQPASGAVAVERIRDVERRVVRGEHPVHRDPGGEGQDAQDDEHRQEPGEVPAPTRRRQPPRQPDRAALELPGDDRHAEEETDRVGDEQDRRRDEGAERPRARRGCGTPPGS